jgi:methionine-rich copper-binding protein CopC
LAATLLAGPALNAGPAMAHADYDYSIPAEDEVVPESPETVEVYFRQEMRRSGGLPELFVVNQAGDTISLESNLDDEDRTHMTIDLPPALPNGRYTVIWHTLSDEDGEEAKGAFHFYVGEEPDDSETPATSGTPEPTPAPTTPVDAAAEDDSDGVPVWGLIAGIVAAAVISGGAGIAIGRSR